MSVNLKDDIRYYLPQWSKNSGPKWRTPAWLCEAIGWNTSRSARTQMVSRCESMVEAGELMKRTQYNAVFYAHAKARGES